VPSGNPCITGWDPMRLRKPRLWGIPKFPGPAFPVWHALPHCARIWGCGINSVNCIEGECIPRCRATAVGSFYETDAWERTLTQCSFDVRGDSEVLLHHHWA
jgi:hypothetical protein